MKALRYFSILCMLLIAASFNSCKDDDDKLVNGVTGQSWQECKALEIISGKELSVSFNANGDWTATTKSEWCNILSKSGKSGKSTLRMLVATTANAPRTAIITIEVKGYNSASFQVTQNETGGITSEDMEVNAEVDSYLRDYYLWNDEYQSVKLDFTKDYKSFLYDALSSMTTNILDYKPYIDYEERTQHSLFSFIEKKNPVSSSRSTKIVKKELVYSFGITGISAVYLEGEVYHFYIQGVYPNSPAEDAGLERGTVITQINGKNLTYNLANKYFGELLMPSSPSTLQITNYDNKQTSITSTAMYINPVIFKQVKEINGHRIGYLVYDKFDAAFDEELFEAFKYFKSQNVTDLILDLRYNGGGHTMSANLISSCIAGSSAANKICSSIRFNESRMKAMNNKREDEKFMYSNYANLNTSLAAGDLGLSHIYCLVGYYTASASELVINSLRGIDIEVTLIGEKTTGKNVGMEPVDIVVRENTYSLLPITFQSYNAKGFGDYEKGFIPDRKIDETNPYEEEGVFYRPRAYGANNEFLYAAAVEMITGTPPQQNTRSITDIPVRGKERKMHAPVRPGFDGMIKIPLE